MFHCPRSVFFNICVNYSFVLYVLNWQKPFYCPEFSTHVGSKLSVHIGVREGYEKGSSAGYGISVWRLTLQTFGHIFIRTPPEHAHCIRWIFRWMGHIRDINVKAQQKIKQLWSNTKYNFYRPQNKGDNTFGSIRPSVCVFVCLCVYTLYYWRRVVGDSTWLAKCSKKSYESQVRYTYKIITRW